MSQFTWAAFTACLWRGNALTWPLMQPVDCRRRVPFWRCIEALRSHRNSHVLTLTRFFSCSSWTSDHNDTEAAKQKQESAFGLGGGVAMRCSTLLAILTGVLLYLVLGAVVFRALEAQQEEDKYIQLQDLRRNFLLNFTCIGPENLQSLIEVAKSLFYFI